MGTEDAEKALTFHYVRGQEAPRPPGFVIDWRRLGHALLERPARGRWLLRLDGGVTRRVEPGEVMFVPAETRHALTNESDGRMSTLWILALWRGAEGRDLFRGLDVPPVLPRAAGDRIAPLLRELVAGERDARAGSLAALARRQTLGFRLLETILPYAKATRAPPVSSAWLRIAPALAYLRENLANRLDRDLLARQVHLSPTRFHAVFKEATGEAPMEFVMAERLRRARELLVTTDLPMYAIAARCGFGSPYYFSRCCRAGIGLTPSAFRASFGGAVSSARVF